MSKLFSTLSAGALALTLSGFAFAQQDQSTGGQQPGAQQQQQQQQQQTGQQPAGTDAEFQAALKKCDALTGAEKQKCVDATKKKFGQM